MIFAYEAFTLFGGPFQDLRLITCFDGAPSKASFQTHQTYNPAKNYKSSMRFGLLPFRSPLLGEFRDTRRCRHFFLFLRLLRCFTSAGTLSI